MRHNVFRLPLTTPHREDHRQRFIQDSTRQNRLSLRRDSLFDLVDVKSQHFSRSFYLDKEFRRTHKAEGKKQFYYLTAKNTPTQAQLQEQSRLLASSDLAIEHLFDRQLHQVITIQDLNGFGMSMWNKKTMGLLKKVSSIS